MSTRGTCASETAIRDMTRIVPIFPPPLRERAGLAKYRVVARGDLRLIARAICAVVNGIAEPRRIFFSHHRMRVRIKAQSTEGGHARNKPTRRGPLPDLRSLYAQLQPA